MRATVLTVIGTLACRSGFDPIAARPADAIGDDGTDAPADAVEPPPDAFVTLVITRVDCADAPKTVDQLCIDAGFAGATVARGYHWFECAGPGECPTGWAADGLSCADWCGAADCATWPYCGAGRVITERAADATTTFDPAEFFDCVGFNPGWLVRAYCK